MNAYNVALFIHLLGVVTLFSAIGLQQRGGAQIRGATTLEQLRLWLGLVRTTQGMYPAAIVLLLAGGLFMTGSAWTFTTPWIAVALVGLACMAVAGALVVGRRLAALGAAAAGDGPVPPDLARLIARPDAWVCLFALNGVAIGILWLMATKPGWAASVAVVVGVAAIGAAIGLAITSRSRRGVAVARTM